MTTEGGEVSKQNEQTKQLNRNNNNQTGSLKQVMETSQSNLKLWLENTRVFHTEPPCGKVNS
jgi:hypothetical protein